ncbi:winged helix-turn-helix transcriptional regulator [Candidatus Woesearchaeota archaeon]|nr:winged helix-turn-helix transcriptional regulator [Candidatus Woesearchaeota archaeon]
MNELSYKLFFKAISNKTRFEIVTLLRKGSKSVTAICNRLGFEQSRVSHNLKCLVDCGFVNCKYNGKNRVYSLDPEIAAILAAIDKHLVKYRGRLKTCGILERRL